MAKQPDTTAAISFIRRRFSLILLAITGAAFILRFAACMELADTGMVIRPPSTTDMATYKELALAVRQGNFPPFFDYQPFYYVIFLPLAWIFSPSGAILPVHLLQSLTGAATVWLCGASAARLFGRKGGIIAALLLALSCFHIFYTPYLLLEVVFAFWSAMVLWSGLKAIEPDSRWYWSLISGLSLSCAMLTRGSALLWLPGVLLLLFLGKRRKLKSALLHCGIMVLAFILPVLPFAVHNTRAVGKLSGASVAGSKVLILGNSPEAPAGGLEYPRSYHQWMSEEENGGTPASVNMRRWIFSRPLDFLELTFRKLLLFWDSGEIPNNVSFVPHADRSTVLQLPIMLPWGIIAMPALAGILLLLRHFGSRRRALLLWMCGIIWLATAGFYLLARFRIVALPVLCIAAAGCLMMIWHRRKRFRESRGCVYATLLTLLVGAYVVWLATPFYRDYCEPAVMRMLHPNGIMIVTDSETALYDHGPLLIGGSQLMGIPPAGLAITKRFPITRELRESLTAGMKDAASPLRQKIMLRVASGNRRFGTVSLLCNGEPINAWHKITEDRSALWLTVEFSAPLPAEDYADFTFEIAPTAAAPEIAAVFDMSRIYHRSAIKYPGEATTPFLAGEAVAEWCFPHSGK